MPAFVILRVLSAYVNNLWLVKSVETILMVSWRTKRLAMGHNGRFHLADACSGHAVNTQQLLKR